MVTDDHMWKPLEDCPNGCVEVEVMYADGRVAQLCSCDVHWNLSLGKETPYFWRYSNG